MTAFGVDRRQYRLLVRLFRELSDRRELTGQLGLDRSALGYLGFWLVVIGGFLSVMAVGHPTPRFFLGFNLVIGALILLPMLVSDAADAFMNPAEAFVLAHQPIHSRTFIAAKASYIVYVGCRVLVSLNLVPACAGVILDGNRWFSPLAHLTAAALAGVFLALVTCGFLGVLFQILPLQRLRHAALWMQLSAAMLPILLQPAMQGMTRLIRSHPQLGVDVQAHYWSALPLTWFVSLGLAGHADRPELYLPVALPAMIISLAFIGFGARSLAQDYMTRVVLLTRSSRASRSGHGFAGWFGTLARRLAGTPSGRAAFAFAVTLAVRDWQFRRLFLAGTVSLLVPLILRGSAGAAASPFAGGLVPAHFLPHAIGFMVIVICRILVCTDQYRAAWIFLTAPIGPGPAFARGLFLAVWLPCIALPHVVAVAVAGWYWTPAEALMFAAYSAAVASCYLAVGLLRVEGLPFASAPIATAPFEMGTWMAFFVAAGLIVALQVRVIFPVPLGPLIAAALFAVLACATARVSLRAVRHAIAKQIEVGVFGKANCRL